MHKSHNSSFYSKVPKHRLHLTVAILLVLILGSNLQAQTSINMANGIQNVDGCQYASGYIYDDGGCDGAYSNYMNGYITITVPDGISISLTGNYDTESSYDYIEVYDGIYAGGAATGNRLGSRFTGSSGTINVTSTTGSMTIYFHSDGSVVRSGFELHFVCNGMGQMCGNKPQNLSVDSISLTTAKLQWTSANPNGPFMVVVNNDTITTTTTSLWLTQLTSNTNYNVAIRAVGDDPSPCCLESTSFQTLCENAALPLMENFDNIGMGPLVCPPCWIVHGVTDQVSMQPHVSGDSYLSAPAALMMPCAGNGYTLVTLPPVDAPDLRMLQVRFKLMTESIDARVAVGVCSIDNPSVDNFTMISTIVPSTTDQWKEYTIPLSDYSNNTGRVSIRCLNVNLSGTTSVWIDDVVLDSIRMCDTVSNLRVSATTSGAAQIAWDRFRYNPQWGFVVRYRPFGQTSWQYDTTVATEIRLTGLTPGTTYEVEVAQRCDSLTLMPYTVTSFTTLWICDDNAASPYVFSTDTYNATGVPINSSWGNTFCQVLYCADELTAAGLVPGIIGGITLGFTANTSYEKDITICIDTTSEGQTLSILSPSANSAQSGPTRYGLHATSNSQRFDFSTPFIWDGEHNLLITILVNQPTGSSHSSSGFYGLSTHCSYIRTLYAYRDGTPYTLSTIGSLGNYYSANYRPSITFMMVGCQQDDTCGHPVVEVMETTYNSATIGLMPSYGENLWTIEIGNTINGPWQTIATDTIGTTFTKSGLTPNHTYYFRVTNNCGYSTITEARTQCQEAYELVYDNLYSCNVTCRYGRTYNSTSDAQYTIGIIDNGPSSASSQHTVHTNQREYDSRTYGGLKTVPEGYSSSVRLGNWNTNNGTEQITYRYIVDTNIHNLLIMKYAAVLEDPSHSREEQPRFNFTITDMIGQIVSPCYTADFIADASLGWQTCGDVLWKDWTTVGIDLGPLHGQTIDITLTTFDCTQGGHYGYAYYVFDCTNKLLSSANCDAVENTFYAPDGFNYSWYAAGNPTNILSTSDSLHVTDENTYICDLAFVGAPVAGCSFKMSAISGIRYPWARFECSATDTSECLPTYRMHNRSIITMDSAHCDTTSQGCESYLWLVDNAAVSTELNPSITLDPGWHDINLVAMIGNGSCGDTATQRILAISPCLTYDTIDTTICAGGRYIFFDTILTTAGSHTRDSLYLTRTVNLSVQPSLKGNDTVISCDLYRWPLNGIIYDSTGVYIDSIQNAKGCDSVVSLHLHLLHSSFGTYFDTCVENNLPRHFHSLTSHGDIHGALDTIVNSVGCDSIISYNLKVWWNTHSLLDTTVCDNQLPVQWGNSLFLTADTLYDTIPNHAGADSLITRVLHTLPTYRITEEDTICNNQYRIFEDGIVSTAGTYTKTLHTHSLPQCDSLRVLHLHVSDTSIGDTMATACDIFQWMGRTYRTNTTDSLHRHYQNAAGCDSSVVLHLNIYPSYSTHFYDTIYYGDTSTFLDSPYTSPGTYPVTYTTIHGCDSTLTLHLTAKNMIVIYRNDSICEGQTFQFFDQSLTHSGIYRDTIFHKDITTADTTIVETLSILPWPNATIDSSYECNQTPWYILLGETNAPHYRWSCSNPHGLPDGSEYDSILYVNPLSITTFYLTADYRLSDNALCPVVDSVQLSPLDTVKAIIHTDSKNYTLTKRHIKAEDYSRGNILERQWYLWYEDQEILEDTKKILTIDVPEFIDSIRIVLTVSSNQCADTDTVTIKEYREAIFFPNVFTPTQYINNYFKGVSPSVAKYELWIFDREGQLVFHTTDINQPWDGTHNGKDCSQGSYAYKCRYTSLDTPNSWNSIIGQVTLIR